MYGTHDEYSPDRRSRQRSRLSTAPILIGIEVVLLAGTAYLFRASFPDPVFWIAILVVAAVGAFLYEGAALLWEKRGSRKYASRFDMKEQIRRLSAQADELDPAMQTEEIIEGFVDDGRRALKEDRLEDAAEFFRRAIELDPQQSRLYNFQGLAFTRLSRLEEAVDAYCKAISIDYDFSKAHFNLALAYEQLGRQSDALEEWTRFVDVGEVIGERADMLERARQRIEELREGQRG